jgi:hypothetical protein
MSGGEQAAMGQSGFMRPVAELKCRKQAIALKTPPREPMSAMEIFRQQNVVFVAESISGELKLPHSKLLPTLHLNTMPYQNAQNRSARMFFVCVRKLW